METPKDRERLTRLMAHSKKKYGLSVEPDWRYRYFFDYLQLSPSYRLAHLTATRKAKQPVIAECLPKDFDNVKKTYAVFGDVWHTDFWDWWVKTAQYQFGVKHVPRPHELAFVQPGVEMDQGWLSEVQRNLEQYLLADRVVEGKPGSLILAIPLHLDRKAILNEASKAINNAIKKVNAKKSLAKYDVLKNKPKNRSYAVS